MARHRSRIMLATIFVAALVAGTSVEAQQSSYAHRMATQLQVIGVREDQAKSFDRVLKSYFRRLEGAPRRVNMAGRGDFHVMIKREVDTSGKRAIKQARKVLDEQQMKAFERYIRISNKRFISSLGLD